MGDRFRGKILTITPAAASFATPYTSGDVIGAVNTLSKAVEEMGGAAVLDSIVVLDKANQKSALDLVFFNEAPVNSIGADNDAYGLNDADLTKVVGRISVAGSDYVSSGTNNAEATLRNVGLLLQALSGSQSLYMAVVARGGPTYGSATDLVVKLGFKQS